MRTSRTKNAKSESALEFALRFVKTRDRFESEVRSRLAEAGYETESAIERLKSQGILNDVRTVDAYVTAYADRRGAERIRADLVSRGAPPEVVDARLAALDTTATAQSLARARMAKGEPRPKVGRFLAGRGFNEEEIESVLDRLFS